MKGTTGSRGGWGHLALEPAGRCCVGDRPARASVGTCVRARDVGRCVDRWGVGGHVHACSLWTLGAFPRAPDTHGSLPPSKGQGRSVLLAEGWPRRHQCRVQPRLDVRFSSLQTATSTPNLPVPGEPGHCMPGNSSAVQLTRDGAVLTYNAIARWRQRLPFGP